MLHCPALQEVQAIGRVNSIAKKANFSDTAARYMAFGLFDGGEDDEHNDIVRWGYQKYMKCRVNFFDASAPVERIYIE